MEIYSYDCREGFPSERIEAVLHSIELATKHQSSNFGLGLIMVLTKYTIITFSLLTEFEKTGL